MELISVNLHGSYADFELLEAATMKSAEQAVSGNGGQAPSFASLWTSYGRRATTFNVRVEWKR